MEFLRKNSPESTKRSSPCWHSRQCLALPVSTHFPGSSSFLSPLLGEGGGAENPHRPCPFSKYRIFWTPAKAVFSQIAALEKTHRASVLRAPLFCRMQQWSKSSCPQQRFGQHRVSVFPSAMLLLCISVLAMSSLRTAYVIHDGGVETRLESSRAKLAHSSSRSARGIRDFSIRAPYQVPADKDPIVAPTATTINPQRKPMVRTEEQR